MVDLAAFLYSQFITYDRLTEIVNDACKNSNASMAHIYIDIHSLLKSTLVNIGNVRVSDYTVITSCMINMAIHYKSFFRTRYQTDCKVFFIYSDNCPEVNKKWVMNYNEKDWQLFHHSPIMTDIINKNIELMKILCPYINNVFFIPTGQETGVAIQHLMNINKDAETQEYFSFIVSKDTYNFQLVYNDNTIILRPKRYYSDSKVQTVTDTSYYVSRKNIWKAIFESRKTQYDLNVLISPELASLVLAISGISSRCIKSTIGIKRTLQIIQKLINEYAMPNAYSADVNNLALIYMNCKPRINTLEAAKSCPDIMIMENNFKAIDIPYQYDLFLNVSPEFDTMKSYLVNLYDPEGLKHINEEYFKNNPLDLMRL